MFVGVESERYLKTLAHWERGDHVSGGLGIVADEEKVRKMRVLQDFSHPVFSHLVVLG